MAEINPYHKVRIGVENAINGAYPLYNKVVPSNQTTPSQYLLITNQTKNQYEVSKNCFEWLVTFNLECINVSNLNQSDQTHRVDVMEEVVTNSLKGMSVPDFKVKNIEYNSFDLDLETATKRINRRIISYTIWLNYVSG